MSESSATVDALHDRLAALDSEVARYGPRSVPASLRRDHVLTAATVAFVADGFEGASMQRIAERAGVTKPVVYSLFGSKAELFAAVIDRESDDMAARVGLAIADEGESNLRAGIRAYLHYVRDHNELWGPILASTHHEPVGRAALRLQARQVELIAASIRRGYDELGISADAREVEALARLVMGAVSSVADWWRDHPELTLDDIADLLDAGLGPSLDSIRAGRSAAAVFEGERRE